MHDSVHESTFKKLALKLSADDNKSMDNMQIVKGSMHNIEL